MKYKTRQAFHAWERKVRKHQVNCTRWKICTEVKKIQTSCTSVIPKKGTWTSASFSKCRSALIRHKLVHFFCKKQNNVVWIVYKKKQVFFYGLNRLENPARTCTSSNLPCGHVIKRQHNFGVAAKK